MHQDPVVKQNKGSCIRMHRPRGCPGTMCHEMQSTSTAIWPWGVTKRPDRSTKPQSHSQQRDASNHALLNHQISSCVSFNLPPRIFVIILLVSLDPGKAPTRSCIDIDIDKMMAGNGHRRQNFRLHPKSAKDPIFVRRLVRIIRLAATGDVGVDKIWASSTQQPPTTVVLTKLL